MANWKVTIKGTGQLNGPVPINKTVEMDERAAKAFSGSKRAKAIEAFVQTHYPGVKINPSQFSANVNPIKSNSNNKNSSSGSGDLGKALIGGLIGGAVAKGSKKKKAKDDDDDKTEDFYPSIGHLTQISFHGDLTDTMEKLDAIAVQTTGFRWEFSPKSDTGKQNNRLLNACVKQFKYGVRRLKELTSDEQILKRYKKKLSWLKWKRFLNYSWLFLVLIGIFLFLGIMSLFE